MSLISNLQTVVTRIATELKAHRVLINGNAADLTALTTTAKGNLVAAINEVVASIGDGGGAVIDDATTSTSSVWSSSNTQDKIVAAVASVVASAPGTLDTLKELADALGDDPNFATSTATALGNRVRFDAAQALTAPQKAQANANMGALSLVDSGDPTTNFVTTFEAGLL